jgi:outer membrane immunogenic protein
MRPRLGWALASVLSIGFSGLGGALAADMPVKARPIVVDPSYNWSGWYVGANVGYTWDDSTGRLDSFTTAPPGSDFTPAVTAGGTPAFLNAKHEGAFGGGQAGYNWQMNKWLVGLEADIQGADIGKTSTIVFPGGGGIVPSVSTGRDHLDWFGTFRGRVGMTANTVLFYATGGLAFGGVSSSATNVFTPGTSGTFAGNSSDTRFGWAAGAGVEWAFAPNWRVKGEYLHVDLGSSSVTILDPVNFPTASATYRFHHEFDSIRVGVNYRINGPVVAKYRSLFRIQTKRPLHCPGFFCLREAAEGRKLGSRPHGAALVMLSTTCCSTGPAATLGQVLRPASRTVAATRSSFHRPRPATAGQQVAASNGDLRPTGRPSSSGFT